MIEPVENKDETVGELTAHERKEIEGNIELAFSRMVKELAELMGVEMVVEIKCKIGQRGDGLDRFDSAVHD